MRNPQHAALLIGLVLFALSGNAQADWSRLGNDKESVLYVDPDTLNKSAGAASLWILKDFHQVQIGPTHEKFRSAKIYYEFNCREKQVRQGYLTRHYAPMAGAGTLSSDPQFHPWMAIMPGTEKAKLFEFACN
ncbi:hypothetical protein Q8A64_07055 [Oxalobacteraceae bacterium R-40]|uniref:Surface-adhesin protein E-like domain-containing protein n=1 Tax=Keguizhuia sedimenti TaxID=3064264 RepID=A0ABU1BMN6_9BURK|nr:hypothetical protein [Oxalobacteraceae bacterium R-40]